MKDRLRKAQFRWRLASLPLRMTTLGLLAVALGVGAVVLVSSNTRMDATAASVLVAVVFGITTVLQQRQVQRRQNTVDLITAFQGERLSDADVWMANRIAGGRPVCGDVSAADDAHVIVLLDYYEFLALLAQRGLVDVPLLLDLRGAAMTRCFDICRTYIEDRRSRVFPGLYACLEVFADVYTRRTRAPRPAAARSLDGPARPA